MDIREWTNLVTDRKHLARERALSQLSSVLPDLGEETTKDLIDAVIRELGQQTSWEGISGLFLGSREILLASGLHSASTDFARFMLPRGVEGLTHEEVRLRTVCRFRVNQPC